jgi:hypothetical protein
MFFPPWFLYDLQVIPRNPTGLAALQYHVTKRSFAVGYQRNFTVKYPVKIDSLAPLPWLIKQEVSAPPDAAQVA